MPIDIVPYTPDLSDAVRAFNKRMREGGTTWGWYEDAHPDWVPKRVGQKTWREYWLAVEDKATVRGCYALKPHEWMIKGTPVTVTDWQGPVSEGILSRQYNTLGLRLLRDMLKKHPLLYSWGHGGYDEPMVQMLRTLKWTLHDTPFMVRVTHPGRFLRLNNYLRKNKVRKLALDVAAYSGAGTIGIHALHTALSLRKPHLQLFSRAHAEVVSRFGTWTDDVWHSSHAFYSAIALRDAMTMNALVPEKGWPPGIRLKVMRQDVPVGWAVVMDTSMSNDARFGDLRVGSIVDALAPPRDAHHVIGAAFRYLRDRGVDLVVANHSHPDWIQAFHDHGFLVVEKKRIFAVSPALQKALEPWDVTSRGLFVTNMDGHGPHAL